MTDLRDKIKKHKEMFQGFDSKRYDQIIKGIKKMDQNITIYKSNANKKVDERKLNYIIDQLQIINKLSFEDENTLEAISNIISTLAKVNFKDLPDLKDDVKVSFDAYMVTASKPVIQPTSGPPGGHTGGPTGGPPGGPTGDGTKTPEDIAKELIANGTITKQEKDDAKKINGEIIRIQSEIDKKEQEKKDKTHLLTNPPNPLPPNFNKNTQREINTLSQDIKTLNKTKQSKEKERSDFKSTLDTKLKAMDPSIDIAVANKIYDLLIQQNQRSKKKKGKGSGSAGGSKKINIKRNRFTKRKKNKYL